MSELKSQAIKLCYSVASQRGKGYNVSLLTPSDGTDSYYVPPQEITLTPEDIKRLYEMIGRG